MQKSTSTKPKTFKLLALASTAVLALGAIGAVLAGVTPANAASLAHQVDTQIAVFMVPLTILVLMMLFEVTRIVVRGTLPVEAPVRRSPRAYWSPAQANS